MTFLKKPSGKRLNIRVVSSNKDKLGKVVGECKQRPVNFNTERNFKDTKLFTITLTFADDHVSVTGNAGNLERALNELHKIPKVYNVQTSASKPAPWDSNAPIP